MHANTETDVVVRGVLRRVRAPILARLGDSGDTMDTVFADV